MAATVSDIQLIIFNFTRNEYELQYQNSIPAAIKFLMVAFSKRIIEFQFLTLKQDLDFVKLLQNKMKCKIQKFVSKFRASEHNFNSNKFHELCDNLSNDTIVIIHSNWGNTFGGYTTQTWGDSSGENKNFCIKEDDSAFAFMIQSKDDDDLNQHCPIIFDKRKHVFAMCSVQDRGPVFGNGFDINIGNKCNVKKKAPLNAVWRYKDTTTNYHSVNWSSLKCYTNDKFPLLTNLCGGNSQGYIIGLRHLFDVIEYEVFELIKMK